MSIINKYKNTCPLDHSTFEKYQECNCNFATPFEVWKFKEQQLEEKQKLLNEALEVIRFYSVSGKYHYGEYWKNGEHHFNPPSICFDYGETANEFLKKVENDKTANR